MFSAQYTDILGGPACHRFVCLSICQSVTLQHVQSSSVQHVLLGKLLVLSNGVFYNCIFLHFTVVIPITVHKCHPDLHDDLCQGQIMVKNLTRVVIPLQWFFSIYTDNYNHSHNNVKKCRDSWTLYSVYLLMFCHLAAFCRPVSIYSYKHLHICDSFIL